MANTTSEGRLEHLTGARFLATLWIVCAHYLPKSDDMSFNGAVFKVNIAVCFWVVVSGFVTQWAYGNRDLSTWVDTAKFYIRRLGKLVITFWLALIFACFTMKLDGTPVASARYVLGCFVFLTQWVKWCPNGPSWFVFALLPSWLLYPVTRHVVRQFEAYKGESGLIILLVILYCISFGPAVFLLLLQGGDITFQQHANMSFWPPSQLADFAIGVVVAAMVQRKQQKKDNQCGLAQAPTDAEDQGAVHQSSGKASARLADVCIIVVCIIVFFVPRPSTTFALHLNGWEPLYDHGLALLFAGFLYWSADSKEKGKIAQLLSHPALVSFGECSFEVYIFQRPMHDIFRHLFDAKTGEVFMVFLFTLWIFANRYMEYVQKPLDKFIRSVTNSPSTPARQVYEPLSTPENA